MRIADKAIEPQAEMLRLLRQHGAQSRRQLAERSGYSISLVRQLTESLARRGLIEPDTLRPSTVPGRPSQLWSLAPDACLAVGLDMGSRATNAVILDALGKTVAKRVMPQLHLQTADDLVNSLAALARQLFHELGARRTAVRGVGLAFGGFVDFKQGVSLDAMDIPHAQALPLQQNLADALHLPVILDDRSRAMALAEARCGAARDSRDCICVNVSGGIGTGVLVDGQLYRGALGLAGELGHIPVMLGGSPCRCGGRGCLETLASGTAIETRARDLLAQGMPTLLHSLGGSAAVTVDMVMSAARAGDPAAFALLESAAQWLGLGLATLINLYSPELVVLTGSVMRGNDLFFQMVRHEAERYILPLIAQRLRIVLTELNESAAALGAATFVLDAEFDTGFARRLSE